MKHPMNRSVLNLSAIYRPRTTETPPPFEGDGVEDAAGVRP
jgi:hypothetical protein